ncbi:MAG: hypothetical protein M1834_005032 [Cirrosporium novae-zelandiae]|nr:MAG: hypothetical protein M1834_005032 [Cirrosporium novae-zelandiae]
MRFSSPSLPALLFAASTQVHLSNAWGSMAHKAVAFVAQNFVTSETESWAQDILGSTATDYLASVASWADTWKYTSAGTWSKAAHYIDANDDPLNDVCNVNYPRDCGDLCIINAIANYTARVQESSLSDTEVANSLKFIIHYIGDLHQPLHVENYETGGNGIDVTFDGDSTNLHSVWDSDIAEKIAGGSSETISKTWAATLTTAIKSGTYSSSKSSWLDDADINDANATAMAWAEDSNSYDCTYVFADGLDYIESEDLSGDYYNEVDDAVKELVAKAGYRLAAWLNLIATGETGL